MKLLNLKGNESLIDVRDIPLDKTEICGFWFYSAYLYNHDNHTKKFVIVAFGDRKMYFVGEPVNDSWDNIQKVVDKFIIEHVVGLAKEKLICKGIKIKAFKNFIKVFKHKIYIENIENYENLVLMLKHDYVAFKDNVLNYIKSLNDWLLYKD